MADKVRPIDGHYEHFCPGCEALHPLPGFEGDADVPTFVGEIRQDNGCHYVLEGGRLRFFLDSPHGLAGTTVALPDLPA